MQPPNNLQNEITIVREIAPVKRLGALLLTPAMLVVFFWAIFIIETEGLSPRSDYLLLIAGCIKGLITEGCTKCVPDLGYIIFCSVLGGPFAIPISFKIWQALNMKIVLTGQNIILKWPLGKDIQSGWNVVKEIQILRGAKVTQLIFTRDDGPGLFDKSNAIFCTLTLRNDRLALYSAAANLILNKIETHNISIDGERELLEKMAQKPDYSLNGPSKMADPTHPPNHPTAWS